MGHSPHEHPRLTAGKRDCINRDRLDGSPLDRTESGGSVHAHYADPPYSAFAGPVVIATGIDEDDISAIAALPSLAIGILWSNQAAERFGFRVHLDADPPSTWQADEVPASQSALNVGMGMADDHLNLAVGSDGSLYAAVKTSYDMTGYPRIALLIRRPGGAWDDLYEVDQVGTRPIVVLNETTGRLHVVYTSDDGLNDIVFKVTPSTSIDFGPRSTLINGSWNNSTSTPQNWTNEIAVLASNGSTAAGVITDFQPCEPGPLSLRGYWRGETIGGGSLQDSSGYGNHGSIHGDPEVVTGYRSGAISLDGDDYAVIPASCSLEVESAFTVAAWIRPTTVGTQRIIRKVSGSDGFSLFLSANGYVSVRLNDSNGLRVNSQLDYPTDGVEWMHVAATYDGSEIKLYINGILDTQMSAVALVNGKGVPLSVGATSAGVYPFRGALDDLRVYNYALSEHEILWMLSSPVPLLQGPAMSVYAIALVASGFGVLRRARALRPPA